jgi:hypothetical protein
MRINNRYFGPSSPSKRLPGAALIEKQFVPALAFQFQKQIEQIRFHK